MVLHHLGSVPTPTLIKKNLVGSCSHAFSISIILFKHLQKRMYIIYPSLVFQETQQGLREFSVV